MADTLATVAAEWLAKRTEVIAADAAVASESIIATAKRAELAAIEMRAMPFLDRSGSSKLYTLTGGVKIIVYGSETLGRMGPGARPIEVVDP